MGTLTAQDTRLPGYCEHKLPTSCRLTSIPECCACADERNHSPAYSTYIDGVGYVLRGTRWQRYCWFCKEFWENRVRVSGLRPGQTRIPEEPNQTAFLERWYEFHRGYKIVLQENGEEERVPVIGEDLADVPPGCLPRTMAELEQGGTHSELVSSRTPVIAQGQQQGSNGPSLDTTLEELFLDALRDEEPGAAQSALQQSLPVQDTQGNVSVALRNTEREQRRIAALRRELTRMRNGIERVITGLRELGETVPDHTLATVRLANLGRTLDDIATDGTTRSLLPIADDAAEQASLPAAPLQVRVEEAQDQYREAQRMHAQAMSEVRIAEQEVRTTQRRVQQLQREQRTTENYVRLFGTREEIQAQGDNYESPIGGMFTRAWERFRAAEEARQEERTLRHVLANESAAGGEDALRRLDELYNMPRDVWGVPRIIQGITHQDTSNTTQLMEMARDEVFSGQVVSQDPVNEEPDENEHALGQYYSMLRSQGWDQTNHAQPGHENTFPQSMLSEHPSRTGTDTTDDDGSGPPLAELEASPVLSTVYELNQQNLVDDSRFLLDKLVQDDSEVLSAYLRGERSSNIRLLQSAVDQGSDYNDNLCQQLYSYHSFIWACGLPAERARRGRLQGRPLLITANATTWVREERVQNIEAMAEAFQMSAEVRRSTQLNGPEQLRMLYRLQRGDRLPDDRTILWNMLQNEVLVRQARQVLVSQVVGVSVEEDQVIAEMHEQRMDEARAGDHSRQDLQARRQTTSALAIAAGRTAMQAGAQGAIQRMLDMHHDMRGEAREVANSQSDYEAQLLLLEQQNRRHVRLNRLAGGASGLSTLDFDPESESDSDDGESATGGLDAKDSGRPEAKSDEDMTVKLECNICFSQVADVACLPCGHLVMCRWCSDQHSPPMARDRTRPRAPAICPACRKQIKQKLRVFRI